MEQDAALDARIGELVSQLFGLASTVEKLPSENNYVCRLRFAASLPDKVIKVGVRLPASVLQEQRVLRRLREHRLAVPEVERTQDDAPDAPWPFLVMPFIGEADLGEACRQRWPWASEACRQAGAFLARLHVLPPIVLAGCALQHYPALTQLDFAESRWDPLRSDGDAASASALARLAIRANRLLAQPVVAVMHESFIPAQVQADAAGAFAVTDWETIRLGRPLRDVGCFLAGLEAWYGGEHGYGGALVAGYRPTGGLAAPEAAEVGVWRAHYLLHWANFYLQRGQRADGHDLARRALGGLEQLDDFG